MAINLQHLLFLQKCKRDVEKVFTENTSLTSTWVGQSARRWLSIVDQNASVANLGEDVSFNRLTLREYISAEKEEGTAENNIFEIVINILAWGGMPYRNGSNALKCWDEWRPICLDLLCGRSNHIEAYKAFFEAHAKGTIYGIGPAYYTKLIFFLGDGEGLIMDQWTSKSVNLIHEQNIIKLSGRYVSKFADSQNYIDYIQIVSELSELIEMTGTHIEKINKTEELIFSISSKKKPRFLSVHEHQIVSRWRAYVEKEWRRY